LLKTKEFADKEKENNQEKEKGFMKKNSNLQKELLERDQEIKLLKENTK